MYGRYVVRRIINGVVIYVVLMFIFSLLFNATNEQTVKAQIDESIRAEASRLTNMSTEQIRKYIEERKAFKYHVYHLDRPFFERVMWRTFDTVTFRYGMSTIIRSSRGDRSVWKIVSEVMPRTILLFTTAIVFVAGIGVWLGLKKAQSAGRFLDKSTSVVTMIVYGMPTWWLGMIMIMIFAYLIPIFPSGGLHSVPPPQGIRSVFDLLYHMALPLLTLLLIGFWGLALLTRNIVLGILQEDFIMTARARGLSERSVLFRHTMGAAAPPMTTIVLLALLASVAGNIVFEGIFGWPGMGNLYWIAVEQNDIPVLMGLLSVTTGLYVMGLVVLDLAYGFLDPRIKVGGRGG
jgi:peptide/nickel transport system permease protein